ncbi:MAG TPA: FecR family protein, partial [Balneolales bacterium]|nr:FecR family protein [Balneolales bacterium]
MAKNNKELADLLNDGSFLRWLRGNANNDEIVYWENWVNEDLKNEDLVRQARLISNIPFKNQVVQPGEIKEELNYLNGKIDVENKTSFDNSESVLSFINEHRKKGRYQLAIAAAVAILIGIISFLYFSVSQKTIQELASQDVITVPYGKRDVLKLSDGSKIIVNANSKLKYKITGSKKSIINIWLYGEAYFSITHRKSRVLNIHTDSGIIRDLGTQFDINTRFNKTRV